MKNNGMIIKLVALDLDGTLLNSRKELPADYKLGKYPPRYQNRNCQRKAV